METVFEKKYQGIKNLSVLNPKKRHMKFSRGSFHPKTWFIEFDDCLRVVIGSANIYINDWTVWSNNFWVRDFPLLKEGSPIFNENGVDERKNNFEGYLKFYFRHIT